MTDLHSIVQRLIDEDFTDPIVHLGYASREDDWDEFIEVIEDFDIDYTIDETYGDPDGNVVKTGQVIVDLR